MSALDLGTLTGFLALDDAPMQGTLDRLPSTMSGATAAMGAAGLALGAYIGMELVQGFGDAANADRLNDRLAAALNLDPSQATRAGEVAGRLYVDAYGESLEEVNTAVEAVMSSMPGMMDAPAEALEGLTGNVMDLAAAMEIDVTRATQVAGQMLTNGLASDAEGAVDLLTASLQRVPAAVREDLLDATDEYGPFFAQLGLSGEEAMGALVDASADGMYGIDKLGDALKEFTIRSTDMSATSVAAYDTLGLNAEDMTARILAGGDDARGAFDEIVGGLQSLEDPGQRANTAIALFGTPLEDLNAGEIPAFLDSMANMGGALGDVSGAADAMGDTLNGNAATSWTSIQRTFDSVWQTLASNLLPIVGEVTAWLADNPELVNTLVVALMAFAGVLLVLAAAQWAANSAMLASPVTWIILGIALLVAAIIALAMNWDAVAAWIATTWGGFVGWLTEVTNGVAAWWNSLWAGFGSWVTGVWDGFIAWIVAVWLGFVGWLQGMGAALAGWWNGLWSSVGAFVRAAWTALVATVVGIFRGFLSTAIGIGSSILGWWGNLWTSVRSGVTAAWNGIISWMGGIGGMIQGALNGAGSWLVSIGRNILDGLMGGLQAGWNAVVGWINGLGGGIIDTFASILGIRSPSRVFRLFGQNIVQGLALGLDDEADSIGPRVEDLVDVPDPDDYPRRGPGGGPFDALGGASSSGGSDGGPRVFHLHDTDGRIMATMRGAAAERSELDGTTAGLGTKSTTPVV